MCVRCFAIRNTARQMSPATFNKSEDAAGSIEERASWYAEFTWNQRTAGGHSLVQVLKYLIWEDATPAIERLWNVVYEREWNIYYFGISSAAELLGIARPEEFHSRNNRFGERALICSGV